MEKFYDAHCHVMNLSHPNLSAMAKRVLDEIGVLQRIKIGVAGLLFAVFGKAVLGIGHIDDRIMNLLAIMETELGDCLLQMEEDLRNSLGWGGGPTVAGKSYDRIVLMPLIMDFGLKGYGNVATPYRVRWKPIASQVLDLCLGIREYYKHRDTNPLPGNNPTTPLFEIHPFMGINTRNYDVNSKPDGTTGLKELLEKNFAGFERDSITSRCARVAERDWRDFSGDIGTVKPYDFIGIKVYPPLGFNPWPTEPWEKNATGEMEKVRYLYRVCQAKNIPITSHCSPGGFLVEKQYKELAHPGKWAHILREFPRLRLNLAHFGGDDKDWREAVARLVIKHENVYSDISYRGVDKAYYRILADFLEQHSEDRHKLLCRIIFGSDFMINLMNTGSYSEYMRNFKDSGLSVIEKDMLCNKNPESFLFIGPDTWKGGVGQLRT